MSAGNNKNSVSNRDLYDAINELRKEFTDTITKLVDGRITKLEDRVQKLEVSQAVSTTKLAILITGIALMVSTGTAILTKVVIK